MQHPDRKARVSGAGSAVTVFGNDERYGGRKWCFAGLGIGGLLGRYGALGVMARSSYDMLILLFAGRRRISGFWCFPSSS